MNRSAKIALGVVALLLVLSCTVAAVADTDRTISIPTAELGVLKVQESQLVALFKTCVSDANPPMQFVGPVINGKQFDFAMSCVILGVKPLKQS